MAKPKKKIKTDEAEPEAEIQAAGSDQTTPVMAERRQGGDRRQSQERRAGARGLWDERRLMDRRKREYSMFGNRVDDLLNDSMFELPSRRNTMDIETDAERENAADEAATVKEIQKTTAKKARTRSRKVAGAKFKQDIDEGESLVEGPMPYVEGPTGQKEEVE